MTELINPRLFERVERSLRKRLNTSVRSHLLRCAAHAKSEDEFMAAAGRLLLNPHERREWLATWAVRRYRESLDTHPASLDSAPVPLDGTVPHSDRASPSEQDRA